LALSSTLGFPRIGPARELKKALESFWSGKISEESLQSAARGIRRGNWELQKSFGIDHIPSNDFSLYDHVLDAAFIAGAIPERFLSVSGQPDLRTYFAMARGIEGGAHAMTMTKWFDTNYHYIVPEFYRGQTFRLSSAKPVDEFLEAQKLGVQTRPVLLGPLSLLKLGKMQGGGTSLELLDGLLGVYEELFTRLSSAGAQWVQMDEPILALDCEGDFCSSLKAAYARLSRCAPNLKIVVASYYNGLDDNLALTLHLPVDAVHLDIVHAPEHLADALELAPENLLLSLGVVDGRNVWRADLRTAFAVLKKAEKAVGKERIIVAPSCPLLHVPVDMGLETEMDADLRLWLSFAKQKVAEVAALAQALNEGEHSQKELFDASDAAIKSRRESVKTRDGKVRTRTAAVTKAMAKRESRYAERKPLQQQSLRLPPFPTTTIGSFPQTKEVRSVRAAHRAGTITRREYDTFMRREIEKTVRFQEEAGLDVLVHGEFERADMVEYFAEYLEGVAFTKEGWVQSYGSRCVKPPVIFGDVERKWPMTVEWARYAQSLTSKPMKGMLTGPVTMEKWSFTRDDQPQEETCLQIALAIRDEVEDLEKAGIRIIQIDEPAFREGLPLRRSDWRDYLNWAAKCFRIASGSVRDETQIHTHMCYANFNDIIEAVAALDADVISIESSRSRMELLEAFHDFNYPNDIGPGIYDVHSPVIPSREEMEELLRRAAKVLSSDQIWVNPDCGLKTRTWEEVGPSLRRMVDAARTLRAEVGK